MTTGALAGTLQIFVGGSERDYRQVRPVLEAMGDPERICHVGPHGAGYTVRACGRRSAWRWARPTSPGSRLTPWTTR